MSISNNTDDDAAALREIIRRALYGVHTSMPGVITAVGVYKGVRVVSVQPAIQQIDTLDGVSSLKAIDPIPNTLVVVPHAEDLGLSITVPLRVGNEGMLHFSERGLDNWIEKGGVQPPAEPVQPRSHDLSDAVFVPGITSVAHPISNWSDDAVEVRNGDGTTALSVSPSTVAMRSGDESISLPGDGSIYISGDIVHTGSQTTSGAVNATTSLTVAGAEVRDHDHGAGSYQDSLSEPVTGTSGALV